MTWGWGVSEPDGPAFTLLVCGTPLGLRGVWRGVELPSPSHTRAHRRPMADVRADPVSEK